VSCVADGKAGQFSTNKATESQHSTEDGVCACGMWNAECCMSRNGARLSGWAQTDADGGSCRKMGWWEVCGGRWKKVENGKLKTRRGRSGRNRRQKECKRLSGCEGAQPQKHVVKRASLFRFSFCELGPWQLHSSSHRHAYGKYSTTTKVLHQDAREGYNTMKMKLWATKVSGGLSK